MVRGDALALVWWVVALEAVSLVLNLITQSAGERAIWAPVALLLLASSTVVAHRRGLAPQAAWMSQLRKSSLI